MEKIAHRARRLKRGSWLVSLTKKLPSADEKFIPNEKDRDWECVLSVKLPMSWGPATVFVH